VVHEGGGGRAVLPDDQAGCDSHVCAVGDGGGEYQGGAGQGCADGPDGDEDGGGGEEGEGVLGDSYGKVSEIEDMLKSIFNFIFGHISKRFPNKNARIGKKLRHGSSTCVAQVCRTKVTS
jgi:hypothetical protein